MLRARCGAGWNLHAQRWPRADTGPPRRWWSGATGPPTVAQAIRTVAVRSPVPRRAPRPPSRPEPRPRSVAAHRSSCRSCPDILTFGAAIVAITMRFPFTTAVSSACSSRGSARSRGRAAACRPWCIRRPRAGLQYTNGNKRLRVRGYELTHKGGAGKLTAVVNGKRIVIATMAAPKVKMSGKTGTMTGGAATDRGLGAPDQSSGRDAGGPPRRGPREI